MKRIAIFLFLLFSMTLYADVLLKPVNLPENWKIEKIEKNKNHKIGNLSIPFYIKQHIKSPSGAVIVHYYLCGKKELADKVFNQFFKENKAVYRGVKSLVYRVEATSDDLRNTLRFMELNLSQQIKLIFPEVSKIKGAKLVSESKLSKEVVQKAAKEFGIKITSGMLQIFSFDNSKVKLKVEYFHCANRGEAFTGYKNARIKNTNTQLVKFLYAQEFLARLSWVD